jgi:diacylglycerol kinase family enzyme
VFSGPSLIGNLLGVPSGPKAVDVIAARLVEKLDLGQINGRPFLLEVTAPNTIAGVQVEASYWLRPSVKGAIALRNLAPAVEGGQPANPKDGQLEIVLQAETRGVGSAWLWSRKTLTETRVFLTQGAMAAEQPFQLFVDGEPFHGSRFSFSILPNKVQMITGRRLSD